MGRPERATMRAASGSTQMLYSAAGVTLPSQHGAPPITTVRPTFAAISGARASGQRHVGERTQRDQRNAGMGANGLDDGFHRVGRFGRAARRRIVVIAQPVFAVEPFRMHIFAQQGLLGARKTGTSEPHNSAV